MKFNELYNKLNKLDIIKENPDTIISRSSRDERISFHYCRDTQYSILIYECTGGIFKYVARKDETQFPGHAGLRRILSDDDHEEMSKQLISNIPVYEVRDIRTNALRIYDARIWTTNKIFSVWKEFHPKMIPIIEEIFTRLRQKPEEYIFEFDGATYNREHSDYSCYDWKGLHNNKKLPTKNTQENINNNQDEQEAKRKEDALLLAKIKMGEKPTLNKRVARDGD